MLEIERADRYRAPIVLEGGSIHVDGQGTVMATEECLLNPNRNPELSREQIEQVLFDHLGAEKMIWLGQGVYNDETDGHVDNLACFARPGVVLLTYAEDESDPQHAISRDAEQRLQAATDARGRSIEVIRLPSPGPITISAEEAQGVDAVAGSLPRRAGDRLAASYANFYLGHQADRLPSARRPLRRASRGGAARLLPGPRGRGGARPRDPARRRQHPLHHPTGPGAPYDDGPDDLMAQDDRRVGDRDLTIEQVQVGAADAARAHPHENLVGSRAGLDTLHGA